MSPWVWDTVRSEWFGFLQTFRTRASILHQGSENTKVASCCADENDDDCFSLGCCCCLLPSSVVEIYYSNLASYNGCSSKFELACWLNSACLIARFTLSSCLPSLQTEWVVERGTVAKMWCGRENFKTVDQLGSVPVKGIIYGQVKNLSAHYLL